MFPLFETIRVQEGRPDNLRYHEDRMTRSCRDLFGRPPAFRLAEICRHSSLRGEGLFRLRVSYDCSDFALDVTSYGPKKVTSLRLIRDNSISYAYKFSDRAALQTLYEQRGPADDIVIIKNGLVTDASYANLVFKERGGQWVTPQAPLLKGTQRQQLLDEGLLQVRNLTAIDLRSFESFKLINAMLRFDFPELPMSAIIE